MKNTKMKYGRRICGFLALLGLISHEISARENGIPRPQNIVDKLSQTVVPFVQNEGQMNSKVAFYAKTFGGQVFVTKDNSLVYHIPANRTGRLSGGWVFSEEFLSNTRSAIPTGLERSEIRISQFKGRESSKWSQQLATFNSLSLGEQYPDVSVNLNARGNNIEKLFVVSPGGDPDDIEIAIKGVNGLTVNERQQLVLATDLGPITFTAPVAYQVIEGKQQPVSVAYRLLADNHYGFKVEKYDHDHELVIDPLLASTFIGGVNDNPAWNGNYDQDIAYSVLATGDSIYIGGITQSTDFPVYLGYDETPDAYGGPDGFIARLSSDLTTLYSATFIGTNNHDRVTAIALDADGAIVATGQAGVGFPVTRRAYNGTTCEPSATGCGFVAKFSADLSTLIASSIISPSNYPSAIAVGNGGIYFAGRTNNPNYPVTAGAYEFDCCPPGAYGIRPFDGFAGKISSNLKTLEAMTYLGGDGPTAIAVAPDGSVYISDGDLNSVTGYLASFDAGLTTKNAHLSYYPGTNSGSSRHYFRDISVGNDFVIAVGQTYLNDLPVTPGAYDSTCGTDGDCNNISTSFYIPKPDGFVGKYSLDLQTTQALTYFGASDNDIVQSVWVDGAGGIVIAGDTYSPDLPTTANAHDNSCGDDGSCNDTSSSATQTPTDVFVARFDSDLMLLDYSSYLGGSSKDSVYDLVLLDDELAILVGSTSSEDFPTSIDAFDFSYAGGTSNNIDSDAFVSVFDLGTGGGPPPTTNVGPIADAGGDQQVGSAVTVYLDGGSSYDPDGNITDYRWRQVSGKSVRLRNRDQPLANFKAPRIRRGKTYTLVFELEVTDDQGATATDQTVVDVL
jgi:hypothetical protein